MTKRLRSKYKLNRRLGENLWGRPKSPVNKRDYPPGQHAQMRRRKPSDYGIQLAAKQKLRGYYGNITEKQFRRTYDEAVRRRGDTSENLIGLLERRLDAVVYRMKFVPTVFSSRQFVNHGHVMVNGRKTDIPSYICKDGDAIQVRQRENLQKIYSDRLETSDAPECTFIAVEPAELLVKIVSAPSTDDIGLPVNINQVVEFLSR